jgi:hypothetical protein
VPVKKKDLARPITDADLTTAKNRGLLPLLNTFADELEGRIKSGKLKKELKGVSALQLADKLAKIATALKGPAVQLNFNGPPVAPTNHEKLRATSAMRMPPAGRLQLRAAMRKKLAAGKAVEAEVMPRGTP